MTATVLWDIVKLPPIASMAAATASRICAMVSGGSLVMLPWVGTRSR